MTTRPQSRARSFFALLCLLAVVLLYAPLGGAAWSLYSTACCTTKECPIKGHDAKHSPAAPQHAMDCSHDMPAMSTCTMSCCHNADRPALAPVIFVLPSPFTVSVATSFEAFVPLPELQSTAIAFPPLSPPPRICVTAA
jgi:hypothetical protein